MKKIIGGAIIVVMIVSFTILYNKHTNVYFNGITLSTSHFVTTTGNNKSLGITRFPTDGTMLFLTVTNNYNHDEFINSMVTSRKGEILQEIKTIKLKSGEPVYLKLVRTPDIGNMLKLYGHIEGKSLSFTLQGDGESFLSFYDSIKNAEFNK